MTGAAKMLRQSGGAISLTADITRLGMFVIEVNRKSSESDLSLLPSLLASYSGHIARIDCMEYVDENVVNKASALAAQANVEFRMMVSKKNRVATHYPNKFIHFSDNTEAMLRGEFSAIRPKYAEISITLTCNFRCHQCTSGTWKAHQRINGYPRKIMGWERIKQLIDICKDAGIETVLFAAGGEPTLHPDLLRTIRYSKHMGLTVGLYSNGSFTYGDQEIAELLEHTDLFRISLHAVTPQEHAAFHGIRSKTMVGRVLKNIETTARLNRKMKTNFGLNNIFNHRNASSICSITDFIANIAANNTGGLAFSQFGPEIKMRPSDTWGIEDNAAVSQFDRGFYDELSATIDVYTRPRLEALGVDVFSTNWSKDDLGHDYQCCSGTGWYLTEVDPDGNVFFCTQHSGNENFRIGNVFKQSIEEIWNGTRRQHLLTEHRDFSKCPVSCKQRPMNRICADITKMSKTKQSLSFIEEWIDFARSSTIKNSFI